MSLRSLSFVSVRHPPLDLNEERLVDQLVVAWGILPRAMTYFPEGGGSHHWHVLDESGGRHFVTVDDLDDKEWLGSTRDDTFAGLSSAFETARLLRQAGLRFVVAGVATRDGTFARRLDDRFAVSVYPFYKGHSYPFGRYFDATLRSRVLDHLAELHLATPAVRGHAPRHVLSFEGQRELRDFLADPERPWDAGPFSEATRGLLMDRVTEMADLVNAFDHLAERTAPSRQDPVMTHGEPHPANLISVDSDLLLVDWDTAALAPRERDLSLVVDEPGPNVERYERVTGHEVDFSVVTLYRLRWYLDDLASTVKLFRRPHDKNPDTQRWRDGLSSLLPQLPEWMERLG